jgi:GT2 family glycosyltransferase
MTHVSIIVVNYNSSEFTKKCLGSLAKTVEKNFKFNVVIVDNGSREAYQIPTAYQKFATILRSESNLGFTGGNNAGIQHAIETFDSEFVFLLNNDTEVDPKALKFLVEHLQSDPKIGAVSPKIYFGAGSEFHITNYSREERGNVIWYAGGSIDWQHLAAFHRGVDEIDRGQFDSQNQSDFATGCAVLIRRELLEKIGGFDERYFLYFEDVDLSLKISSAGYQIRFEPKAKVWHFNAGSSGGSGSDIHNYYQTRNRLLLAFTHGNWQNWLTSIRIMLQIILDNKEKSNTKKTAVFHALTNNFGKKSLG